MPFGISFELLALMVVLVSFFVAAAFLGLAHIVDLRSMLLKHKVEKTPHSFGGKKKQMVFYGDVKEETFKEATLEGGNAVYLKHDFGNERPTFFARPFLDYVYVGDDGGTSIFYCRLDKEGNEQIKQGEWDGWLASAAAESGVEFDASAQQYSEKWFEQQREENVRSFIKAQKHKTPGLKESIRRDGEHADSVMKKKQMEWMMRSFSRRRGVRGVMPSDEEELENV